MPQPLLEYEDKEHAWLWLAFDCSDGEPQERKLALSFASTELSMEFKDVFECVAALGHELQRSILEKWRADSGLTGRGRWRLECSGG